MDRDPVELHAGRLPDHGGAAAPAEVLQAAAARASPSKAAGAQRPAATQPQPAPLATTYARLGAHHPPPQQRPPPAGPLAGYSALAAPLQSRPPAAASAAGRPARKLRGRSRQLRAPQLPATVPGATPSRASPLIAASPLAAACHNRQPGGEGSEEHEGPPPRGVVRRQFSASPRRAPRPTPPQGRPSSGSPPASPRSLPAPPPTQQDYPSPRRQLPQEFQHGALPHSLPATPRGAPLLASPPGPWGSAPSPSSLQASPAKDPASLRKPAESYASQHAARRAAAVAMMVPRQGPPVPLARGFPPNSLLAKPAPSNPRPASRVCNVEVSGAAILSWP